MPRFARHLAISALSVSIAGCATRQAGVPVPRPFPGAAPPPGVASIARPEDRAIPEAGIPPPPPGSSGDTDRPPAGAGISDTLISTALAFRGTPYRLGGSDPSGFDCSGFVQWVFAQHGTALPREVREQFRAGDEVDESDVQPGDLVFFETVTSGASHVGIALGGGEFVHAPSSRGVVRVERYTGSYWGPRWVGARRIRHRLQSKN